MKGGQFPLIGMSDGAGAVRASVLISPDSDLPVILIDRDVAGSVAERPLLDWAFDKIRTGEPGFYVCLGEQS